MPERCRVQGFAHLGLWLKQELALEANLLLVGYRALQEAGQIVQLQPARSHTILTLLCAFWLALAYLSGDGKSGTPCRVW